MRRLIRSFAFFISMTTIFVNTYAEDEPAAPTITDSVVAAVPSVADSGVTATPPAAETPSATSATPAPAIRILDLSGCWNGSWSSCVNGHNGPMRASFTRLCNGNYEVTFAGRFCKLIPFRYKTTLNVTGYSDGVVYLSGSQNLGPIFGTFTYNAWANDRQFVSGYSASKDQGQFVLSR